MRDRARLREAWSHNNVVAFSMVVRNGESSLEEKAYGMRFGGLGKPPGYFTDFSQHPKIFEPTHGGQKSSAAGAYQATWTTWNEEQQKYGWESFGKQEQDEFFVARLIYRRALDAVIAGRFGEACRLLRLEWTSLPGGAEENRATKEARDVFYRYGGTTANPAERPQEIRIPMAIPAVALALLPELFKLIPKLAPIFSSGSERAEKNVAAATIVADAVVAATQSENLQAAIETMQTNPEALKAAQAAVDDVWMSITESGEGGIAEARKQAANPDQMPPWKNPAVWVTAAFVPLIYGAAYAVLFTERTSDDLKTMVVTAIFAGLLGSITGFFLGSSLGSQKKDAMTRGGA